MTTNEGELIARGYWRYDAIGIPVPGFAAALLDEDDFFAPKRWRHYFNCVRQRSKRGLLIVAPFALEVEHRRRPITRLRQLRKTLHRICQPGYDLGPARELEEAFSAALEAIRSQRAGHSPAPELSAERNFEKALAEKQLPVGPTANLAIMRATLKIPVPT